MESACHFLSQTVPASGQTSAAAVAAAFMSGEFERCSVFKKKNVYINCQENNIFQIIQI